jgi:hypothetical protein
LASQGRVMNKQDPSHVAEPPNECELHQFDSWLVGAFCWGEVVGRSHNEARVGCMV